MENHNNHTELEAVYKQVPPDYWDTSYRSNPVQWLYHFWRFRAIRKMIAALPKGAKILDVGCGSGFAIEQCTSNRLDFNVYGIDVTEGLIDYAKKKRPQFHFQLAKGEELPYENNEFDCILYLDVIEHLIDPERSLKEARRCLKDEGNLIILVVKEHHPLFRLIWWAWLKLKGKVWHEAHLHIFTEKNLEEVIQKAGFKIKEVRQLFCGMSLLVKAIKNKTL